MQTIRSFTINHDTLVPGLYLSRQDGDADTYDVRLCRPNAGHYLSTGAIHTLEHLFATYARNSVWAEHILYVGPMGCRTGMYLLVRGMTGAQVISLVQESFAFMASYDGEIPGAQRAQCGNCLDHDLPAAREEAKQFVEVIKNYTESKLTYPD